MTFSDLYLLKNKKETDFFKEDKTTTKNEHFKMLIPVDFLKKRTPKNCFRVINIALI